MRAGALLAGQLAQQPQEGGDPTHLLLWQPVASGQQQLQQFLRLQAASQWLGNASSGQTPAQALALGESVHIAGYTLSANLAQGLGDARLTPPTAGPAGRLVWLEVSSTQPPQLPPASAKPLAAWSGAGWRVQAQAVNGPAFWQTVGTDDAPALIAATLAALTDIPPP